MWPTHTLQEVLSIKHPIIQAPMGGATGFDLVAAVSRAGGLGSLPCAAATADQLHQVLLRVKEDHNLKININFFAHKPATEDVDRDNAWLATLSPYFQELEVTPPDNLDPGNLRPFDEARCEVLEDLPPKVVSFHFGLPNENLVERIRRAGILIMSSATTVEEARFLEQQGCDIIIAQGYEAGGHRGMFLTEDLGDQMGTFALVPQIVDAVNIPVVAAGGIGDGRGIVAALALGASGVQMGTAYLHSKEAMIDASYRQTLVSPRSADTVVTNVISGRPTRIARTRLTEELGPIAESAAVFPRGFAALDGLTAAIDEADTDFSAHYCGQAAQLGYPSTAEDLTHQFYVQSKRIVASFQKA